MPTSVSEPVAAGARPPRAFARRVAAADLPGEPTPTGPVTEADLDGLPPVAVRYLRAMGVVGRSRAWSLQAHWAGRFRRGPDQPWMPVDAWQYNSAVEVARLFRMRIMVARAVPMWGWDTYRAGRGRMLGKALGLVTVADGAGPEFDTSELVTWLDDAVLLAPAMLLDGRTAWAAASATTASRWRSPTPGAPCARRCSSTIRAARGTSAPRTGSPTSPAGRCRRPGTRP